MSWCSGCQFGVECCWGDAEFMFCGENWPVACILGTCATWAALFPPVHCNMNGQFVSRVVFDVAARSVCFSIMYAWSALLRRHPVSVLWREWSGDVHFMLPRRFEVFVHCYEKSPYLTRLWFTHSGGIDHVRVHPKFLHSNATSHRWALGGTLHFLMLFLMFLERDSVSLLQLAGLYDTQCSLEWFLTLRGFLYKYVFTLEIRILWHGVFVVANGVCTGLSGVEM